MIQGITSGIKAYFGTFEIISQLKLWKYFAVPMVLSLLLFLAIGGLSYVFSDNIGHYIASFWAWEFGKETFETISTVFGGVIVLTLGFISLKHLILGLSAPFMGPISKKIEDHFTGGAIETKVSSSATLLARGIRISLRNLFRELILTIPILLLGLIPVIGLFSAVLLFLMQAYFAGFGNMDYTLERHYNYKQSVRFVKRNRGVATGNGIVFMLFLLVPFIGVLLVLPFSVTAATMETVKLIQEQNK